MWKGINSWLLFAFVACLIVVPWGYGAVPLLAASVALVGAPLLWRRWQRLDGEDALWGLVLVAYAGVWLLDVGRTGEWPNGEGGQGIGLPLWPILAVGLLIWLRCYRPATRHWWLGIGCGALAAGAIAVFERLVLGHWRASNGMNAIPFGNLALLLGSLSVLATLWYGGKGRRDLSGAHRSRWPSGLATLAASSGILASLLSGTRGGWVAMPLLFGLCFLAWRRLPGLSGHHRSLRHWLIAMLVLTMAVVALPQSGVTQRVADMLKDVHQYQEGGGRGESVGVRLEMWRAGWQLFLERPLTGWGEGRLEAARDAMVARGELHPGVSAYDQLHSDLIDTAARRGLLGVASLLMLYGVPLWLFHRRLGHADGGVRILAVAGLMIPIAFIVFGLSQSMLRDVRGLSGYLGLSIGCWVVMRREEWAAGVLSPPDAPGRSREASWVRGRRRLPPPGP